MVAAGSDVEVAQRWLKLFPVRRKLDGSTEIPTKPEIDSIVNQPEVLDWTGRQLRRDKLGAIPEHLALILSRIGLDARAWCDVVQKFGRVFKRAAGTPESLAQEAIRSGQRWLCARENPLGMLSV